MPRWSAGRVVLVGDAGYCGSPLTGQGTAMALVGAYVLAGELARHADDVPLALDRYETVLRPFVARARELPPGGLAAMAPKSRLGIRLGLTMSKLMTTRVLQPLTTRMLSKTEEFEVPAYCADLTARSTAC